MTIQWLIERGQPEGLQNAVWLEHSAAHPATHRQWTNVAHQAAMFPDRETAERYIADEGLAARAVEHGFGEALAGGGQDYTTTVLHESSNAPEGLGRGRAVRDMADVAQGWETRAKKAEARIAELEAAVEEARREALFQASMVGNAKHGVARLEARIAELEANLRYTAESWAKRCARLDGEYTRLLKAFAAYRSALRSGEPESPELTALGEEALSSRRVPGE